MSNRSTTSTPSSLGRTVRIRVPEPRPEPGDWLYCMPRHDAWRDTEATAMFVALYGFWEADDPSDQLASTCATVHDRVRLRLLANRPSMSPTEARDRAHRLIGLALRAKNSPVSRTRPNQYPVVGREVE